MPSYVIRGNANHVENVYWNSKFLTVHTFADDNALHAGDV